MATGTAEGSVKGIGPNTQEGPKPTGTRRGCAENPQKNSGGRRTGVTLEDQDSLGEQGTAAATPGIGSNETTEPGHRVAGSSQQPLELEQGMKKGDARWSQDRESRPSSPTSPGTKADLSAADTPEKGQEEGEYVNEPSKSAPPNNSKDSPNVHPDGVYQEMRAPHASTPMRAQHASHNEMHAPHASHEMHAQHASHDEMHAPHASHEMHPQHASHDEMHAPHASPSMHAQHASHDDREPETSTELPSKPPSSTGSRTSSRSQLSTKVETHENRLEMQSSPWPLCRPNEVLP